MRRLIVGDAFRAMRLIKAAGVREEFKNTALKIKEMKKNKDASIDINAVGADLLLGVMEGLSDVGAERKFYDFCAGIFEMQADDLEKMGLVEFKNLAKKYKEVEDVEGWMSFFEDVAKIL